jgi:hypothetical protein
MRRDRLLQQCTHVAAILDGCDPGDRATGLINQPVDSHFFFAVKMGMSEISVRKFTGGILK